MEPDKPIFHEPFEDPINPNGPVISPTSKSSSKAPNKLLLIVGGLAILVIIAIVLVVATSGSQPAQPKKTSTDNSQTTGPTAATATSTEVVDGSISQDISTLNDEKDFSADKFSDTALGL